MLEKFYNKKTRVLVINEEEIKGVVKKEVYCKENTSYQGILIDQVIEFTPSKGGKYIRHYWRKGSACEHSGIEWK